ncbi:SDR family NAD(P)-dependent oxidoreductase [Rhizobium ruizarguesonis]
MASSGGDQRTVRRKDRKGRRTPKWRRCQGSVTAVAADVATAEGCDALVAKVPHVDILINNAGIFQPLDFFEANDEVLQNVDWGRVILPPTQNFGGIAHLERNFLIYVLWEACPTEDAMISIWDVNVELKIDDRVHVIRNAREAVAFLKKYWPDNRTASYAAARKACLDAASGVVPDVKAQAAFEVAAKEAGILRQT